MHSSDYDDSDRLRPGPFRGRYVNDMRGKWIMAETTERSTPSESMRRKSLANPDSVILPMYFEIHRGDGDVRAILYRLKPGWSLWQKQKLDRIYLDGCNIIIDEKEFQRFRAKGECMIGQEFKINKS